MFFANVGERSWFDGRLPKKDRAPKIMGKSENWVPQLPSVDSTEMGLSDNEIPSGKLTVCYGNLHVS